MSPFTDLDVGVTVDKTAQWTAAKNALVLMMRTWAGIIILTADDFGLPILVRLLKDPKIAIVLQEIIVDGFVELFRPIVSKVRSSSLIIVLEYISR